MTKRYSKIPAELVAQGREVLEAVPLSRDDDDHHVEHDDEDWDNSPCTD